METIIGMGAILVGIGSLVGVLVAVLMILATLPALFRAWRVLSRKPSKLGDGPSGEIAVQGLIVGTKTFPALADGQPLVWRVLKVMEQVGKHSPERHNSMTSAQFEVDDGTGTVTVDAAEASVMSPLLLGGHVNDAVHDFVGPVFAYEKTPKTFFEEALAPNDFVTVVGTLEEGSITGSMWIVRGEPKLSATEEMRTILWSLGGIVGFAVLATISWFVLQGSV